MTTATGHTSAILASKVKGTAVYNTAGDKIGHVEDVVLDKHSDHIMFSAVGSGLQPGQGRLCRADVQGHPRESPRLRSRRSDQERRQVRRHPPAVLLLLQREARLVSVPSNSPSSARSMPGVSFFASVRNKRKRSVLRRSVFAELLSKRV